MTKSPLRYPGGKTRAVKQLYTVLKSNFPHQKHIISPFFGGGSFELFLHEEGYVVVGNDLFKPLTVFWNVVKTDANGLATKVESEMPITKEKFYFLRESLPTLTDPYEIAKAFYIVNRCSFSGATFSGGFSKDAAENRLNTSAIKRLREVNLDSITINSMDCIEFLKEYPETTLTVIYADPPYYIDSYIYGMRGDMHESFDHKKFADEIKKRSDWMISYNDCPYIRSLYQGCRIIHAEWSYGMNKSKKSSEIIILPPISQVSQEIINSS